MTALKQGRGSGPGIGQIPVAQPPAISGRPLDGIKQRVEGAAHGEALRLLRRPLALYGHESCQLAGLGLDMPGKGLNGIGG